MFRLVASRSLTLGAHEQGRSNTLFASMAKVSVCLSVCLWARRACVRACVRACGA